MNGHPRMMVAWPERLAIGLLALPVALFLGFWFRPLLGVPAAGLALWSSWRLIRGVSPLPLPPRRALVLTAVVALAWTWTAGLGGLFHQEWDHNFRNALLHDLINHPWPVVWNGPQGHVALDYYLAWSLAPALVGKLLGWRAATLAMAGICALGVFLVMLILARIVGTWRWWIPFLVVLWSAPDILGWGMRWVYDGGFMSHETFVDAWSFPLWFLSNTVNYFCVAHLVVPGWIVTLLVVGRRVDSRVVVALSAFLVPLAPFLALGIAPFVAWSALQGGGTVRDRILRAATFDNLVVPAAFLSLCLPLFLWNQGLGKESGWFFEYAPSPTFTTWIKYSGFWIIEILLPAVAIRASGYRDNLLALVVATLVLISLRRAGLSNDLALKVSTPALFVLMLLTVRGLLESGGGPRSRWLLVGVVALGMASPLQEFYRSTRGTLLHAESMEADKIRTFDPNTTPPFWEAKYVTNFHSRPIPEPSVLHWMLGVPPRD